MMKYWLKKVFTVWRMCATCGNNNHFELDPALCHCAVCIFLFGGLSYKQTVCSGVEVLTQFLSDFLSSCRLLVFRVCTMGWMTRWLVAHSGHMPRYVLMMGTVGMSLISTMNIVLFYRLLRADIFSNTHNTSRGSQRWVSPGETWLHRFSFLPHDVVEQRFEDLRTSVTSEECLFVTCNVCHFKRKQRWSRCLLGHLRRHTRAAFSSNIKFELCSFFFHHFQCSTDHLLTHCQFSFITSVFNNKLFVKGTLLYKSIYSCCSKNVSTMTTTNHISNVQMHCMSH